MRISNQERKILQDAAAILGHISGMPPTNPADTRRLFRAANVGCAAAGHVMRAINALMDCHVDADVITRIDDATDYIVLARKTIDSP